MVAVGGPQKQYVPFDVTVAPGSTAAAPVKTVLAIPDSFVWSIEVEIYDGPSGALGFYYEYAGKPIVPWSDTPAFIVVNDYVKTYPVEAELSSGLKLVAYNVGFWPHDVVTRVLLTPISAYLGANIQVPVSPIDLSGVGATGDVQSF